MSLMSKVSAGLQAIVLALVFVVGAAPTGVAGPRAGHHAEIVGAAGQ